MQYTKAKALLESLKSIPDYRVDIGNRCYAKKTFFIYQTLHFFTQKEPHMLIFVYERVTRVSYINFVLSPMSKIEMTKLSKLLGKAIRTIDLQRCFKTRVQKMNKKLWQYTKFLLREYNNNSEGCIVVDDTIINKPHTKQSDTVCYHYDHTIDKSEKMIPPKILCKC